MRDAGQARCGHPTEVAPEFFARGRSDFLWIDPESCGILRALDPKVGGSTQQLNVCTDRFEILLLMVDLDRGFVLPEREGPVNQIAVVTTFYGVPDPTPRFCGWGPSVDISGGAPSAMIL